MRFPTSFGVLVTALALGIGLAGCGGTESSTSGDDSAAGDSGAAAVSFVGLTDGAELTSPAEICFEVTGVMIEPSGEIKPASGHNHLIIDPTADELAAYTTAGTTTPIVKDDTHLHLGDGSSCANVELAPGEHELMAIVADGAHIPMNPPVVAIVKVTAK
jgi:hypothetical protein